VELNFGPSSGLAEQIRSGAPADVFASASQSNMETLVESGDAKDPEDFATNSMEVAVPPDNPARVVALGDLVGKGVKVAVCQPQVPCGKATAAVFARADLTLRPTTEEVDVKSVLTKVTLGEVDAGMVYVTDVLAAGDKVKGVEIPQRLNASTSYPIAALDGSEHAKEAAEFVDLVISDAGAKVLGEAGFQRP
jgi:molybdate transport system substrate-binding protein